VNGALCKVCTLGRQLKEGVPYAYCVGSAPFRDLDLFVNEHVLIPRPETELIPDIVKEKIASSGLSSPKRILDIGTGSGCLAISLARMYPKAFVEAWDISEDTLAVARKNADQCGVEVSFLQRDALSALDASSNTFDLVVSNPPYVSHAEVGGDLADGVFASEPHLALFADANGLAFYRCFAELFPSFLSACGFAVVEHGHKQSQAIAGIFTNSGMSAEPVRDLSQKDRFMLISSI